MSDTGYGDRPHHPCVTLYAVCIHDAARGGDAERMRAVEKQATDYIGELESALPELRGALGSS